MNKDAISIIQQQADTDDKKQKILIVDDSKFNTFGYQYAQLLLIYDRRMYIISRYFALVIVFI